jgi:hypothetical protein
VTTLLIDHVVKSSESRGRYAIGSERKLGAADVHLGLEVVKQLTRGGNGLVKVVVHKDRPGHLTRPVPRELVVVSDPTTHAIEWTVREPVVAAASNDSGWRPSTLMARVSEYVGGQPDGVSRNAIEQNVRGKRDYVRKSIDLLLADGLLEEQPGPRGARLVKSTRPFTSPDLAPTSPGEESLDFAHLARPLQGGEVRGEVVDLEQLWGDLVDVAERAV